MKYHFLVILFCVLGLLGLLYAWCAYLKHLTVRAMEPKDKEPDYDKIVANTQRRTRQVWWRSLLNWWW